MLAAPQTNSQHLGAIVIWASIIGLVQFLFSIVITQALNSSNLFFLDKILIMIYGFQLSFSFQIWLFCLPDSK